MHTQLAGLCRTRQETFCAMQWLPQLLKRASLRATVCNFRESAVRKRKFEFSFSTPKRPFW